MSGARIDIALFDTHQIRRLYDESADAWWFSVVDIVQVLTQQRKVVTDRNRLKLTAGRKLVKADNLPPRHGKSHMTTGQFLHDFVK